MKIGDLVYRKKEVYSDKILYLSDYSHDEEGNLVSIRDLVGVVVTSSPFSSISKTPPLLTTSILSIIFLYWNFKWC